jgi:UbiD family decarboxylase
MREYIGKLEELGELVAVTEPVSTQYEIAGILKRMEPTPVLFKNVQDFNLTVIGNLMCDKTSFAKHLGIEVAQLIPTLAEAIDNRAPCEVIDTAPCQEVVQIEPDLDDLPILNHFERDGGNYITSGVVVAAHPEYGQNLDFHRCMQFSKTEMAVRIVRTRDFDTFLRDRGEVDVAMCIGNAPHVMVAAATSVEIGVDEMEIANALRSVEAVRAKTVDLLIPAQSEVVIEGTVYLDKTHAEGPFVDLTGTYDIVRQEPVLVVKAITHRQDGIWHGLLPGGLEHKLLMGMPREPTIFRQVNEVVRCLDVNVNPGGCSWLHAIVQIDKQAEDDGKKAIEAAFAGHRSCKHVFVVDEDINIYDPLDVEWAMATRFQGDEDLVVKDKEKGSSLDPSAEPGTSLTTKIGFDLTKPLGSEGFDRAEPPQVDLDRFVDS